MNASERSLVRGTLTAIAVFAVIVSTVSLLGLTAREPRHARDARQPEAIPARQPLAPRDPFRRGPASTTTTAPPPPITTTTTRVFTRPTKPATPAPRQSSGGTAPHASCSRGTPPPDVEQAIRSAFGSAAEWALCIAWRESRFVPTAVNRSSGCTGLFQLDRVHERRANRLGYSWSQMSQPGPNAAVAADLYREQGTRPWAL